MIYQDPLALWHEVLQELPPPRSPFYTFVPNLKLRPRESFFGSRRWQVDFTVSADSKLWRIEFFQKGSEAFSGLSSRMLVLR